jgi:hypothetical protein
MCFKPVRYETDILNSDSGPKSTQLLVDIIVVIHPRLPSVRTTVADDVCDCDAAKQLAGCHRRTVARNIEAERVSLSETALCITSGPIGASRHHFASVTDGTRHIRHWLSGFLVR